MATPQEPEPDWVRVRASGAKSFVAVYRTGGRNSPQRRVTIGAVGKIEADKARDEARAIILQAELGQDRAAEKAKLRAEGMDISGPYAPDGMFHEPMRDTYDAALCMYHDQALIPLKTLHFDEGVNMTLGLPIVRTSPDHGTAFGIAGRNIASPGAMIAAIRMAEKAARSRVRNAELACD